ncbi:hypothetical protein VP01_1399g2 [Puccinia sorghi]|uniref:Uncharacterized protein n=1 Tax=Puccinia sorghi TaxID=27349 RepID=A0A0L6VL09_9BASI|nr:hypothetical protein VP01_1399g2 [Puccinia sorghi]
MPFRQNYGKVIFTHYVLAPLGTIVLLFFAYLTNMLIDLLPFTFPAQVGNLHDLPVHPLTRPSPLFSSLSLPSRAHISPSRRGVFVSMHGSLLHLFLHPLVFLFSLLCRIPRRDVMPAKEIGLIAALFLPSLLITWVGTVLIVKGMAHVWPVAAMDETEEDNNADVLESENGSIRSSNSQRGHSQRPSSVTSKPHQNHENTLESVEAGRSMPSNDSPASPARVIENLPTTLPSSNPLLQEKNVSQLRPENNLTLDPSDTMCEKKEFQSDLRQESTEGLGLRARCIAKIRRSLHPTKAEMDETLSQEERLARRLEVWFDPAMYLMVLLIGIPLFFTPGGERRTLPLFTGVVSLSWLFSKRCVPPSYQKVLHPILVTSLITVFVVWAFGSIKGLSLTQALNHYSTGANYLVIFRRSEGWDGSPPSAGDLLSSLLTGGIVALAFPMFRYRADLYNNFFRLFVVITPNCVVSLLLWPWVASKMGMAGDRAITFAARFMSTPFGIQFIVATGGDSSLVVVLICITGIFAVIVRDPLFKLCRTRTTPGKDEYFTIGCTIGIIAAAIGTSSLMGSHSRAAATATVTFVVYGLSLLALVAVPAIANYVGQLAGLD